MVILGGLNYLMLGDGAVERAGGLAAVMIGPVMVRLWAEVVMVVFRSNGTLTEIKEQLERRPQLAIHRGDTPCVPFPIQVASITVRR